MSLNDDDTKVIPINGRGKRRKPNPNPAGKILAASLFPDVSATGAIKATCANARLAVEMLGITCEYDEFHDKLLIGGKPIGQYAGELSDHASVYLRQMIDQAYGFDPKREIMRDACTQLCLKNRFDPILDYLDGLKWDGVERLGEWMSTYLGAEQTSLNSAIGMIALVALVRRAREPGCKFDQIIVWESPEGDLKSSALRALAGDDENFSDQTILGEKDRDQQELLRGCWVYEIADLTNIRKAEVEHVKAFASRTHDRARPAYGYHRIDLPRRCVIFATTNSSEYLKSQTGNRRFWPVRVALTRPIDLASLIRDRDQLFAEACYLEEQGVSIVLPKELWSAAGEEQEQRREADPWEDVLRDAIGSVCVNEKGEEEERIFSQKLFSLLEIPKDRQQDHHGKRIGQVMRRLGWEGPKALRVGKERIRGYCRKPQPLTEESTE